MVRDEDAGVALSELRHAAEATVRSLASMARVSGLLVAAALLEAVSEELGAEGTRKPGEG